MNMTSGAVSITFTLLLGWGIRKMGHRWASALVALVPAYVSPSKTPMPVSADVDVFSMIGACLMSFLPASNTAGNLVDVYLTNTLSGALAIYYNVSYSSCTQGGSRLTAHQWTAANTGSATKRAFVTATVSALFPVGNAIGPQSFQAKDAPEYRPIKITALATEAGASASTIVLFPYYAWQNKKTRKHVPFGEGNGGGVHATGGVGEDDGSGKCEVSVLALGLGGFKGINSRRR